MQNIKEQLFNLGFDSVSCIAPSQIPFVPELIDMCKMNTCGSYGKNWTCPPLVGDTGELIEKVKGYAFAWVFQKIYQLEDSFDYEGMTEGSRDFRSRVRTLSELISFTSECALVLGAGGCKYCAKCAAVENEPCAFPDKAIASLEAHGIAVSILAEKCEMKYNNGNNTVTYFGALLIN